MATGFSTGVVEVIQGSPSGRSWATGFLSTEALGSTNSDVIDGTGLTLAAIALATSVSSACTYTFSGGLSSTAVQPLYGSTGGTLGFGTTSIDPRGKTFVFDPALLAGVRFISLNSQTTSAAAPNATGATYQAFFMPFGQRK